LSSYLFRSGVNLYQYSTASCIPLSLNDHRERCRKINHYVMRKIHKEKPDVIVIFGYYSAWASANFYGEVVPYDEYLYEKIVGFRKAGVQQIIMIGPIPTWTGGLPHNLARNFLRKHKPVPVRTNEGINAESLEWDKKFQEKKWPNGVNYVSLRDLLCDATGCLTIVGPDLSRDLIVFDYGHLTKSGAEYVTRRALFKFFG